MSGPGDPNGVISADVIASLASVWDEAYGVDERTHRSREAEEEFDRKIDALYQDLPAPFQKKLTREKFAAHSRLMCKRYLAAEARNAPPPNVD